MPPPSSANGKAPTPGRLDGRIAIANGHLVRGSSSKLGRATPGPRIRSAVRHRAPAPRSVDSRDLERARLPRQLNTLRVRRRQLLDSATDRSVCCPSAPGPSAQHRSGSNVRCRRARPAVEPKTSVSMNAATLGISRVGGGAAIVHSSRFVCWASPAIPSRVGSSAQRSTGCRRGRSTNRTIVAPRSGEGRRIEASASPFATEPTARANVPLLRRPESARRTTLSALPKAHGP